MEKPSYEELLHLYEEANNKISENEDKLAKANSIIAENEDKLAKANSIIAENEDKLAKANNRILENEDKLNKANNKINELEEKVYKQNLIIDELLKKIEDKDIKLKKQLNHRFGINSDKNEEVIANEAEELSSQKFKEHKKRGRKKGTKDATAFDPTKVEYKEVILDTNEKVCSACGHELVYTNNSEEYKVDIIPSKVILTKYIIKQYKCSYCSEPFESPRINTFDNESFLTPSLGSFIVNNKYNYALPLYRQESILKQLGAPLSRQLLSNYCIDIAEKLEPIYNLLKEELINTSVKVLQADETTLKVIHQSDENRSKCYIWLYATSMYDKPIFIYEYQQSREAKHPQEFLKDYQGYLVCDDYGGYEKINNVKLSRCWFHANKKYADLIKVLTEEQKKKSKAVYFNNMISNIIHENNLIIEKSKNPDEIKKQRQENITPLVDKYFIEIKDLYNNGADKSSEFGKALKYSLNIEDDLRRFLEDGHLPMTNNLAERNGIKPFVILRKNSLFSNTENGAEASCILMSLIQSAKANLVKPDKYIEYVLNNIDDIKLSQLNTLLPTYEKLPEELRYKRNEIN